MLRALSNLVLFSLLLAASHPLAARPMTPEDVVRLEQVGSTAVAPAGDAVAYLVEVPRVPFFEPDGPARSERWVAPAEGEPRLYVGAESDPGAPAWTPDGEGISFTAKRGQGEEVDEERALYVIPRAGGEARRLLAHPSGIDEYSWAPDGERLVFLAKDAVTELDEELQEAGFDAEIYEEDWRFTRVWIAAVDPWRADGAGETPEPRKLELPGSAHDALWCPGGDRLAVTLAPDPGVDASYMLTRIRVVEPESGRVSARIDNPGKLGAIAWSPDCEHLAFVSGADLHDPAAGRLMVASAADGSFEEILPGYRGHVLDLAWRDPETLLFLGDEGVESVLYAIGSDGSGRTVLLGADGGPGEEVWGELEVSARGDLLAMVGESARHPDELFTAVSGGGPLVPERRTVSNPWLDEIDFAPQEVVTYEARDGVEIQGILIRPLPGSEGASEEGRHPLVLKVHGGPESHYRDGWLTSYSSPGQVGAGQGYAVFYPNYRGSTGRGVEFSLLSQGRPAKEEFDDLVDGVDHLVERGLADRDRVGITGGSYGGYASAWGATYYTERFAAAVMFVGISDKISKAGTSDIPEELYLVHDRKRLWDDWQQFLEASPISHVEKARTPILILGGTADTRVDPGQSLELYRHLETLDRAPVRLVRYPGEAHGNRRAASRYDFNLRMMRWFDHYLKGEGGEPPPPELEHALRSEAKEEQEGEAAGTE